MEFSDNVNYVVLSNNADKKFMSKFGIYQIIDVLPFEKLKNNLEMFPESILDKLKQQKSGTKGCGVCKSTINKEYLVKNIEKCLETITSENIYKLTRGSNFSIEILLRFTIKYLYSISASSVQNAIKIIVNILFRIIKS